MSSDEEALERTRNALQIGLRLALNTSIGRVMLAKAADLIDPRWIPAPLADSVGATLERAAASRPTPLADSEVQRILTSAWGVRRVSDELDSLEPTPVAISFTSQVHRGAHAGAPVAVKLQRPGVAAAFRQELMLVDALMGPVRAAVPGLDLSALLAEVRERVMDELDLEHEAAQMRRFRRALGDGPVVVPEPVTDLCRETVLVSSWLDGEPVAGGVGFGHDSTAAALLQFVIGGIREGLVHVDLNGSDVLVLGDGRVGVVDFGAVAAVPRERADQYLAVLDALVAQDPAALDTALVALGVLTPGHGAAALAVAMTALGPLGGAEASRLDTDAVTAALGRLQGLEAEAAELLSAASMEPGELYLGRGLGQLVSLIARIGADGVWRDQVSSALRTGWSG